MDATLGFGPPVDWYPEAAEGLAATAELEAVLRRLVGAGHRVDCVDAWWGTPAGRIHTKGVDLARLAPGDLRFFENYRFDFRLGGGETQSIAGPK